MVQGAITGNYPARSKNSGQIAAKRGKIVCLCSSIAQNTVSVLRSDIPIRCPPGSAFQEVSNSAIECHYVPDAVRVDRLKEWHVFGRDHNIVRLNDLQDVFKCRWLLLPVHKPSSNLRLLRQVFSSAKGFSGRFIVVVRVMYFKEVRYASGCSTAKVQKRHRLPICVLNRRVYDCLVVFTTRHQYRQGRSRQMFCSMGEGNRYVSLLLFARIGEEGYAHAEEGHRTTKDGCHRL